MKKVLTLFLVLCMTSWASAAIVLTIATEATPVTGDYADAGTEYDLAEGSTIWIGVYNDTQGVSGDIRQFACYIEFDSTAAYPSAEFTEDGLIYRPPAVPQGSEMGITFLGYTAYSAMTTVYGDMSNGNPADYTGVGTVFGVKFKCLIDGNDVEVRLMDDGYSEVDSVMIHQVPEPITIALLGLGGLFLRRRK